MYYYVKTKVKWVLKWWLICYYQLLIAVTVLQRVQQIASIKRLYFFFNLLFSCTQCVNRACHLRDRLFSSCTKQRRGEKIAATKDYLFSSAIQNGLFYCKTLRGYRMNCCFNCASAVWISRELPAASRSPSRLQPLPHDCRGAQQLHSWLSGHPAGLLVLPALPAAVARCHRHPSHFSRAAQHQHHQPHQQTGQVRHRGSHQGL